MTTEQPIRRRPYPIPHALRETIKDEVKTMLHMGVIEESDSPCASPAVIVKNKDGGIRFCVNFRKLNTVFLLSLPKITIFLRLIEARVISKRLFLKTQGSKRHS